MAAPKENTNAEKWNKENALKLCDDILLEVKSNNKCRSLASACAKVGTYDNILNYFEDKFKIVFEPIKEAKGIIKGRLIEQGLDGDANPTMAIFILKNNHDMSDKFENKNINANIETDRPLTNEEIKEINSKLNNM